MAGRPPKPTRLKILNGNPGKRPLNAAEPQPARGVPSCPAWLDDYAKEKWAELAELLHGLGVLTLADGETLTVLCNGRPFCPRFTCLTNCNHLPFQK
jgi:phage terminase small subunit